MYLRCTSLNNVTESFTRRNRIEKYFIHPPVGEIQISRVAQKMINICNDCINKPRIKDKGRKMNQNLTFHKMKYKQTRLEK